MPEPETNPYAPPRADPWGRRAESSAPFESASRTRRLAAHLVDLVCEFGVAFVLALALRAAGLDPWPPLDGSEQVGYPLPSNEIMFVCSLLPLAVQWVLIARRAQSVGKIFLGTRIVLRDGANAGFLRGALLRDGPFVGLDALALVLPLVGITGALLALPGFFRLLDAVRIFGPEKRCLHDLIAGTHVAG